MNKVYLSGVIFEDPRMVNKPDTEAHLVFPLLVSHRSKSGIQRELYRISAWGQRAEYCQTHLKEGMKIALQGYLSQRPLQLPDKVFHAVEVAVSELLIPEMGDKPSVDGCMSDNTEATM